MQQKIPLSHGQSAQEPLLLSKFAKRHKGRWP